MEKKEIKTIMFFRVLDLVPIPPPPSPPERDLFYIGGRAGTCVLLGFGVGGVYDYKGIAASY